MGMEENSRIMKREILLYMEKKFILYTYTALVHMEINTAWINLVVKLYLISQNSIWN